jgi:hypothetical protein
MAVDAYAQGIWRCKSVVEDTGYLPVGRGESSCTADVFELSRLSLIR